MIIKLIKQPLVNWQEQGHKYADKSKSEKWKYKIKFIINWKCKLKLMRFAKIKVYVKCWWLWRKGILCYVMVMSTIWL